MAKYKIIDQEKGLKIEVKDIEGQEQQLLGEFQKCQEGQCSCPTDEYKKLDSMEVEQKDGGIEIKLKAKEDQILDKEEISRCLEHTTKTSKMDEEEDLDPRR